MRRRRRDHGHRAVADLAHFHRPFGHAAGAEAVKDLAKHIILAPACDTFVAPLVYSIPIQLLAYLTAVHKGTDVDQPRNLAKSVTVE